MGHLSDLDLNELRDMRARIGCGYDMEGVAIGASIAFAFGTTMIVLGVLLVRSHRRQRDDYEAAEQREATLMNLIARVESDHPELRADMQQLVRGQLRTPRRCRR